jgi:hypothetical protein
MRWFATRFCAVIAALAVTAVGTVHAGRATVISYVATLDAARESPPNVSPGVGTSMVDYDDEMNTLHVHVIFSGLLGTTTAFHIHCATAAPFAGTADAATTLPTFWGSPLGIKAGFLHVQDLDLGVASTYNPAFIAAHTDVAGAEAFLLQSLVNGTAYVDVHSSLLGGGEIRGFLVPASSTPAARDTWGKLKSLYR